MKKQTKGKDVKIREIVEEMDKIELVNTLEPIGVSKENVIVPYLSSLYKDLILRSDAPEKEYLALF